MEEISFPLLSKIIFEPVYRTGTLFALSAWVINLLILEYYFNC